MRKAKMCACAILTMAIATSAIQARPRCDMVFSPCTLVAPATYGDYFCDKKETGPSRTSLPQPGQTIQAVAVPNPDLPGSNMQCGNLARMDIDPVYGNGTLVIIQYNARGGDQATGNCDRPAS